jgi:phage terminase large subunit
MGVAHLFDVSGSGVIRCPYGGIIIFQGMQNHTAESIKSLEGFDIAWVEEAQTLSQRSLDLLRPTIRKPGSELWFTWNPRYDTDPVDVLLRSETRRLARWWCRPTIGTIRGSRAEMEAEAEYDRSRDVEKFGHIWLGGYQKNSEAAFSRIGAWRNASPRRARSFASVEISGLRPIPRPRCGAGSRATTSMWIMRLGRSRARSSTRQICSFRSPRPRIGRSSRTARGPRRSPTCASMAFPRSWPPSKARQSVVEGIKFLQGYTIIVHPRCTHLIDELTLYSYKIDKVTDVVLPILVDKKNHLIDALRYACEGVRRIKKRPPLCESLANV